MSGSYTIRAWNFRGIEHLAWTPEHVSLLAGPNGSGKSTTLTALRFFRNAALRGFREAIRFAGGATALRNLRADATADVILELEKDGVTWRVEIPVEGDGVHALVGERLLRHGKTVLEVPRLQATFVVGGQDRQRSLNSELNTLVILEPSEWLESFLSFVGSIRIYDDFNLFHAQNTVSEGDLDAYLLPSGKNLLRVLRNWKMSPRQYRGQFAWVLAHIRQAFPEMIEDIEFSPDGRGSFYPRNAPDPDARLPLSLGASGLITGLLQLTAVAGAQPGSLIGFDEMENQLHPHAIRVILAAMREMAAERELTIVLTTHSPVVMNEFKGEEDCFFVLDAHGGRVVPSRIEELRDKHWLSHFALGDLYERDEIAPQVAKGS